MVKKILLVDDDVSFLNILAMALTKDFEVYTATGVSEALSILEENYVDCVCSDLNMADGTGIDLLESLKQKYIDIPFVLASGSDECIEIELAQQCGAIFIPKGDPTFLSSLREIANNL